MRSSVECLIEALLGNRWCRCEKCTPLSSEASESMATLQDVGIFRCQQSGMSNGCDNDVRRRSVTTGESGRESSESSSQFGCFYFARWLGASNLFPATRFQLSERSQVIVSTNQLNASLNAKRRPMQNENTFNSMSLPAQDFFFDPAPRLFTLSGCQGRQLHERPMAGLSFVRQGSRFKLLFALMVPESKCAKRTTGSLDSTFLCRGEAQTIHFTNRTSPHR